MSTISLNLPAPIAAIAYGASGRLGVGSEDGTVRLYDAPYHKVAKAVKTSASDVSSIIFRSGLGTDREIWIACGQHVLCFSLDSARMILDRKDATIDICLTDEDDDVLNEIAINATHLAYTLDSGAVGVLDLQSHERTIMKTSHTNLCSNVSFIPDRPREIVTGGYDSALLHFDFHLKSLLSSLQITSPTEPSSQVSLSPPFVLSLCISQTGLIACGLADGRIWLGSGGEKLPPGEENSNARKKRRRKWEGLNSAGGIYHKMAEGPVVAVSFASSNLLLSLTLLGTLTLHEVKRGQLRHVIWSVESPGLIKANALAVQGSSVAVGGIATNNKGILLLQPLHRSENL